MGEAAPVRLDEHGVVLGAEFRRRVSARSLRTSSFITKIAEAAGWSGFTSLSKGLSTVSGDGLRRHTDPDAANAAETRDTSTRRHAVARNAQQRSEEHGLRRIRRERRFMAEVARAIESGLAAEFGFAIGLPEVKNGPHWDEI